MTIRDCAAAVVVLALSGAQPAFAQDSTPLVPNSPWNVEYSQDSCVLARAFGAQEAPVYLRLEQFEPGTHFEVSLVGSPLRSRAPAGDLEVTLGGQAGNEPILVSALFGKAKDDTPALNFLLDLRATSDGSQTDLGELTPAEFSMLSELRIALKDDGRHVVLKPNGLNEALGAMKTCMNELLTHWGIDPAKQRSLTQRAEPIDAGKWIKPEDYPREGLQAGRSANVHFRLTVDPTGRVSDCTIQGATEGRSFARRTCDVIRRRARFQPALDAERKPVTSYYVNTIRWMMRADDQRIRLSEQVFEDIRVGQ